MAIPYEERLARNEALFREVNERIDEVASTLGRDRSYEFLCECADPGCAERITLTHAEYEHVRADGRRFVLAPGHSRDGIERELERRGDHVVVEKTGAAGEVAARLDPRTA